MIVVGPILWVAMLAVGPSGGKVPTYERDVRPILARRCVPCHNAKDLDDLDTSGGLALDTFEAALKGTTRHRVFSAGNPAASPIYSRLVDADEDRRMPQNEDPLDDASREIIRRWIDDGAPRGEAVVVAKSEAKGPTRRVSRALDVTIGLPATKSKEGATQIRLKVGPLPSVSSLALSADGATLAVGTYGQVTLWDLPKREPIAVLDDIPGPILSLAFSPDGKTLAAGAGLPARSGVIRLLAMPGAKPLRTLEGHRDVVAGLAFRADGKSIVSGSYDATVRTWEVATGKPTGVFKGHSDFVYDVAYLPDGKSILSASKDRTLKRIDAATMTEMRTYGEHDDDVLALAVRPDGSGFVSAGNEPQVRSWTLDAEKSAKRVGAHGGPVHQLAFSRDGKRLASASGDATVRLFDAAGPSTLRSLPGPTDWQYAVAISGDGRRVAGGGWDGVVRVWDAEAPRMEAILVQPPSPSPGHPSWLSVDGDGATAGSDDLREVVRWVVGGKEAKSRPTDAMKGGGPVKK